MRAAKAARPGAAARASKLSRESAAALADPVALHEAGVEFDPALEGIAGVRNLGHLDVGEAPPQVAQVVAPRDELLEGTVELHQVVPLEGAKVIGEGRAALLRGAREGVDDGGDRHRPLRRAVESLQVAGESLRARRTQEG